MNNQDMETFAKAWTGEEKKSLCFCADVRGL